MKADWLVAIVLVAAAMAVSFVAGFAITPSVFDEWTPEDSQTPIADEDLSSEDVPGRELPGVTRYPDSMRIKYERHVLGDATRTEVGYVTDGEMAEIAEFYRRDFRSQSWSEAGSDFDNDEYNLLLNKGDREMIVQIEPRSGLLEVEFELREPSIEA